MKTHAFAATLGLLASLVLACGGAGVDDAEAYTEPAEKTAANARAFRVEAATVQPSEAWLEVDLPGEITGSRDALLATPRGGYVERVLVREGQTVRTGQSIARIDSASFSARRDQAQAQLALSKVERDRVLALGDMAAQAQIDVAETQVKVAQANLDLANVDLGRSVVRAPFSGVVGQVGIEVGEVAAPGAPVARLVQLDPISVTLSVSDRDVGALSIGQEVLVGAYAATQPQGGQIVRIDPAADLRTRTFMVEVELPNPDHRLLPGMIAGVATRTAAATERIVIPQDWLVTRGSKIGVFVIDQNDGQATARWVDVTAGAVVHDQVIIDAGLDAGDTLVVTGHRALADGDALLISRSGTCCADGRAIFEH